MWKWIESAWTLWRLAEDREARANRALWEADPEYASGLGIEPPSMQMPQNVPPGTSLSVYVVGEAAPGKSYPIGPEMLRDAVIFERREEAFASLRFEGVCPDCGSPDFVREAGILGCPGCGWAAAS